MDARPVDNLTITGRPCSNGRMPTSSFPLPVGSVARFRLFAGVDGRIVSRVAVCRVVEVCPVLGCADGAVVEPLDASVVAFLDGELFEVGPEDIVPSLFARLVSFVRGLRPGRATRARLFRLCATVR